MILILNASPPGKGLYANDPPLAHATEANAPGWRMDMLGFD